MGKHIFNKEDLIIKSALLSEQYKVDSYNKLSTEFINDYKFINKNLTKVYLFFENELEVNNNLEINNLNQSNHIRYMHFEVNNLDEDLYVVLLVHNNFSKMKIWLDGEFIAYLDGWFDRFILFLKKGINRFTFEIFNKDFSKELLVTISNTNKEYQYNDLYFKDELQDVKRYYLLANRNYFDSNGFIEFNAITNNKKIEKEYIKIFIMLKNIYDDIPNYEIIESIKVKTNNVSKYSIKNIIKQFPEIGYVFIAWIGYND